MLTSWSREELYGMIVEDAAACLELTGQDNMPDVDRLCTL